MSNPRDVLCAERDEDQALGLLISHFPGLYREALPSLLSSGGEFDPAAAGPCPGCGHRESYRLKDRRRRCKACRRTFHPFAARWLQLVKLSARDWLKAVRDFAMGHTAERLARSLAVSERTSRKINNVIRAALLAEWPGCAALLTASGGLLDYCCKGLVKELPDRLTSCASPVFALRLEGGMIAARLHQTLSAAQFFSHPVRKSVWGFAAASMPCEERPVLLAACHRAAFDIYEQCRLPDPRQIPEVGDFIGALWERMAKSRFSVPHHFPLYLAECAFRYNHPDESLPSALLRRLCAPIPASLVPTGSG